MKENTEGQTKTIKGVLVEASLRIKEGEKYYEAFPKQFNFVKAQMIVQVGDEKVIVTITK